MIADSPTKNATTCFHCGDLCNKEPVSCNGHNFCCSGCKFVYELLSDQGMDSYYDRSDKPFAGLKPDQYSTDQKYAYLDEESIIRSLTDYSDSSKTHITLHVPGVHCTSCIWLLEQLHKLNSAVLRSTVDFPQQKLTVEYDHNRTSLRQLVELLRSIGYEPRIRLDTTLKKNKNSDVDRSLYLKIGVAGFAFANIMIFSLPDYFAGSGGLAERFSTLFGWTSLVLSLPVLFYSASDYFRSAIVGLRQKQITIDLPLSIGIAVLFLQSLFDISMRVGSGYLDSFSGLVFFLLIGRLFQQKSFATISFERDYTSYFPIAVLKRFRDQVKSTPVDDLLPGDRIIVRNQEIVPTDAIIRNGIAQLDYQFVTGESDPQIRKEGEYVYAGGRQHGGSIELEVAKKVSHSYLTQLWNKPSPRQSSNPHAIGLVEKPIFRHSEERSDVAISLHDKGTRLLRFARNDISPTFSTSSIELANKVAHYFTIVVLLLAVSAGLYWIIVSPSMATRVVTSILIVACPCALALTAPFSLGMVIRIAAKKGLFLKSSSAVERLATTDTIIFDKTGTLTDTNAYTLEQTGAELNDAEWHWVRSVASQSTHPISRYLAKQDTNKPPATVHDFEEIPGKGICGIVEDHVVRIGSRSWVGRQTDVEADETSVTKAQVWISIDDTVKGSFMLKSGLRANLHNVIKELNKNHDLTLLSGDQSRDKELLQTVFGSESSLHFDKSPFEKLEFVKELQKENKHVLMIGDGLNDAGALQQANVGISISDDTALFAPAADGILRGDNFDTLPKMLALSRRSMSVIKIGYVLSFLYNLIGLSFAASGHLTPVVSAILMPVSSVSVVLFATFATKLVASRKRASV